MGRTPTFKDEFTFEQRLQESRDIVAKYPDRVPVIAERYSKSDLSQLEKKKIDAVKLHESLKCTIDVEKNARDGNHLSLGFGTVEALRFGMVDGKWMDASLMDSVYESFKDEDGFLYMHYSTEKTFGSVHNVNSSF